MKLVRRASFAAVLVLFVIAAAAGCSSGTSASAGHAAADKARGQLVSEIKSLYLKMYNAHFAWAHYLSGEYQSCPTSTQKSELAYYGFFDSLISFSHQIDSNMYWQQAVSLARAAGWKYTRNETSGSSVYYFLAKDSITLRMSVTQSNKKIGDYSVVTAWGPCFDAGPDAQALQQASHQSLFPVPHPSPAPSGS